jgi:hypothetical protein
VLAPVAQVLAPMARVLALLPRPVESRRF